MLQLKIWTACEKAAFLSVFFALFLQCAGLGAWAALANTA